MGVVFEEMAYENKLKVVLHFWRSSYRASMTKLPTHMGWSVIFVVSEIGSLHIRAFEARAKGFWFIFVSASLSHIKLAVSCSFLIRIKPNRHVFLSISFASIRNFGVSSFHYLYFRTSDIINLPARQCEEEITHENFFLKQ